MLRGKIYFTKHALERYKNRVLTHRCIDQDISDKEIKKMIFKDIHIRNIKEVVYDEDMCYIFTNTHIEFRFEKSKDKKGWILITVIRYKRMLPNEEPTLEEYLQNNYLDSGIRTAIALRKRQKEIKNACGIMS